MAKAKMRFRKCLDFLAFSLKKPQKCNKFRLWYNKVGIMLLKIRMNLHAEKGG